ncbi:GntR family transcriptional regulator [Saccharopolyspora hordei]|uniref:DNA-binding GntR family transcriptional regulator n=1 Tax=Saccharopolyspora hordei TaxID=1838 RepID=A0A853AKQ8_9PSEU|nr:GntR family transcriptional regulator [Saccharopolyspora hordei]NYI84386.1 DNA-binding GntR family transcriptional regulator [Saccharopolyspora hordei]
MPSTAGAQALSKSEKVYRELHARILSGRYASGYRLVLDQIAREFGTSPVPVREAVRRLEAEGLVTFTRNVGAEVAGINTSDYADAMQTLAYLEGAATSLAAAHVTADQLAEAASLNDEMRRMCETTLDPVRFTELNHRFHWVLCESCPNKHLLDLVHREWQRMSGIRRSSFTFVPSRTASSVDEHDRIVALIRAGASQEEIERISREHKLRTMTEYVTSRPDSASA